MEAIKSICYAQGENAVDYSTVSKWFEKFCSHCKNFDEIMLKAIEANLVSNTWRVSGELRIT